MFGSVRMSTWIFFVYLCHNSIQTRAPQQKSPQRPGQFLEIINLSADAVSLPVFEFDALASGAQLTFGGKKVLVIAHKLRLTPYLTEVY
jgi:hypothetical protein